ncbi:unnamed protein product [Thelazia callipaeda]|uniref:SelT-like protein n=1 Tax=Thelazia callipaeda TaxID=103827 RepID=A0A0N5CUC4_THECL|nr:unnamed protein product [Thelazia callipaeda]
MITNQIGIAVLGIALLLSLRDIYGYEKDENNDEGTPEKESSDQTTYEEAYDADQARVRQKSAYLNPPSRTTKHLPSIKFLFCVSCGYRQKFSEYSHYILQKYPSIEVLGDNYSPVAWKSFLAEAVKLAKVLFIVLVMMGRDPFPSIGQPTPRFFSWALNNKLSSCIMIFLLSNTLESSLISTGAFEIYLGDEQIWSKLESGRIPSPAELFQIIDQQMELQGVKASSRNYLINFFA